MQETKHGVSENDAVERMIFFPKQGMNGKARFAVESALLFLLSLALLACASSPDRVPQPPISQNISPAVRENIEKLYSPDAKARAVAAARLRKMGAEALPAIPYLLDLLGDETDIYVSRGSFRVVSIKTTPGKEAALTLRSFGKAAVEPVIGRLFDNDPAVRENAAWTLGLIGDKRAEAPLEELMNDPDKRVRNVAKWALKRIRKGAHPREGQDKRLI